MSKKLYLNNLIYKAFDQARACEILDIVKIELLPSNKIGIDVGTLVLTKEEVEKLRDCVKSIYGGIKMISYNFGNKNNVAINVTYGMNLTNSLFDKFKSILLTKIPLVNKVSVKNMINLWFTPLTCREEDNKIILTGSSFYIDNIIAKFEGAVQDAVNECKIILEFHSVGRRNDITIFSGKGN